MKQPFEPLFFLYQRIASDVKEEDKNLPYVSISPWEWYFNIVFDEEFDITKLNIVNPYFLTVMNKVVDNNVCHVFKAFVAYIIDSWLSVKINEFPYELGVEDEKTRDVLNKIRQKLFDSIILENNFKEMIDSANELGEKSDCVNHLIKKQYKYKQLQLATMLIGSYCYFRKNFDLLKILLQYNQPNDSEAKFGNEDIVPSDLQTLIDWYINAYDICRPYTMIWSGHHDVCHGFKQFVILLMYWVVEHNNDNLTLNMLKYEGNKQLYENLINYLDKIRNEINLVQEIDLFKIEMNDVETSKESLVEVIDKKKKELEATIENIERNQELDSEKVDKFIESIISEVKQNSVWDNILKMCTQDSTERKGTLMLKRLINKSFLSKGDTGIYIGFSLGFSQPLVSQIDTKIEIAIKAQSKLHPLQNIKISKYDFKDKIFQLGNDYIIVFINYLQMYDILLKDKGFNWTNDGFVLGTTSRGASICTFGDSINKSSRMIVLNKDDFSKLKIEIDPNKTSIDDLNEKVKEEKLERCAENLKIKEEELRKCVLVEINGKFYYDIKKDAAVCYLDDLNAKI